MYVCSVISHPYFDGLSDPLTSMLFVNIYVNLTSKPFLNNSKVKKSQYDLSTATKLRAQYLCSTGGVYNQSYQSPENTNEYVWIQ